MSKEPFDVESVNPRYRGARMSDVAKALMQPKKKGVWATLRESPEEAEEEGGADPSGVKPPL